MKESTERAREIAAASRQIRRTDKIPHPFSGLLYYMWERKGGTEKDEKRKKTDDTWTERLCPKILKSK